MTRTRRRLLDLFALLGLGVAVVAVAIFVETKRGLYVGLVAQVAAVGLAWWAGACRRRHASVVVAEPAAGVAQVAAAQAEFLAMISHELRTPINAVLGASELLRTTTLDAEQTELVAASDRAGRQLLSLVDGLLDLADLERGSLHVTAQVFDLELELEGAWQMFVQAATDKGLALELDVDAHLPDVVLGDAARLREVLAALLGNAIKFTAEGEVRIVARCVGADAAALQIEITDTGEGLDPAQQAAVFRRFGSQPGGGARRAGGAGVGLTIASALVQRMGGQIGVRSERGRGSTFWFELPNRRPSELQRREFEAALPLRGRRLLLLTGSEELAARVTGQLLSQGCEVSLFSPARASDLAAAPDLGWDCVVADVDVATRLGETLWHEALPVVVLGNRRELREGEFVRLPVHKSDLLQAVLRACERTGRRVAPSGGVRRRVLVAEDNAVNRRMVEKMLEVAGCEVVLTADGDEAVRAFRDGCFELVLMDYQMPGLNGPQAARRIRALPGGADVPIVAFTANSSGDVRDVCRAAGMNGFLCKPLRFADLEQVLARWAPGAAQVDAVGDVGEGASA